MVCLTLTFSLLNEVDNIFLSPSIMQMLMYVIPKSFVKALSKEGPYRFLNIKEFFKK